MMLDFGVFDAVPLGGSIHIQDLAAAVKLDATILSTDQKPLDGAPTLGWLVEKRERESLHMVF